MLQATLTRAPYPHLDRWLTRAAIGLATIALSIGIALPAEAQPARLTSRNPGSAINVRTAPTTQAAAPSVGFAGDRVEILSQTRGADGFIWYRVRFSSGVQGWVRGDFVMPLSAAATPAPTVIAPPVTVRPNPSVRPTPAVNPTPTANRYTTEQINYFLEIALGSEFGGSAPIRKWNEPIRIRVTGNPTLADRQSLQAVINDLNRLVQGISLTIDNNNPNVEVIFAPEPEFRRYEPDYQPTNLGFFWAQWNRDTLNRARILISTTGVTQQERSHLIREELTQSLGLMQDSYRYPDSIFYQAWTDPTQYSSIDQAVISMLYRPEIRPGMTRSQVEAVLRRMPAPSRSTSPISTLPSNSNTPLDFSLPRP